MPPAALQYQYTNRSWMESLLSVEGVELRLDDDGDDSESATETAYLTYQGINLGTSRVNLYAAQRYNQSELVNSFEAWNWATIAAVRWVCSRRCNPVPESVLELYQEAMEELKAVRAGELHLSDISPRDEWWPAWSNVTVDQRYWLRKIRVETPISESSKSYRQTISRFAQYVREDF